MTTQLPWDRFPVPDAPIPPPMEPELPYVPPVVPPVIPPEPVAPPVDTVAIGKQAVADYIDAVSPYLCNHARQTLDTVARGGQVTTPPKKRNVMEKLKEWAKAIAAGIGSLLMVLTFVSDTFGNFLPDEISKPLFIAIGLLTTVMTWLVPNKPATTAVTTAPPTAPPPAIA